MGTRVLCGLLALVLSAAALPLRSGELVLTASCGADCVSVPRAFEVPAGHRASSFRLLSMRPGEPCSEARGKPMAGFSIHRGQDTVLVHYVGPTGTVSDPVPLENLVLEPGSYTLQAVPARGASVTLGFSIQPVS